MWDMSVKWQLWPTLLILIPATAVVWGVVMFTMALNHPDDLVNDDYYRDGMAINSIREKDDHARFLGVTAELELRGSRLTLALTGTADDELNISFQHVTDQQLDFSRLLIPAAEIIGAGGHRQFVLVDDALLQLHDSGIWYLELTGEQDRWRLRQRVVAPVLRVKLAAAASIEMPADGATQ
jgi:hypothetical protein